MFVFKISLKIISQEMNRANSCIFDVECISPSADINPYFAQIWILRKSVKGYLFPLPRLISTSKYSVYNNHRPVLSLPEATGQMLPAPRQLSSQSTCVAVRVCQVTSLRGEIQNSSVCEPTLSYSTLGRYRCQQKSNEFLGIIGGCKPPPVLYF